MSRPSYDRWKRLIDVVVSGLGLVLGAPVEMVLAVCIRARLGSPVLFRQDRPGKCGRIFTLVKFRSMLSVDAGRGLLTDEQRATPLGRLLRSTSLDELPTLWNVLKGDMSLVGPRPLRVEYLPLYSERQMRRHEVRPGVTGLAQVSGRNDLSWEEKFELDVFYVENLSIGLDLKIMWRTVSSVVSGRGVSPSSGMPMQPFTGSSRETE